MKEKLPFWAFYIGNPMFVSAQATKDNLKSLHSQQDYPKFKKERLAVAGPWKCAFWQLKNVISIDFLLFFDLFSKYLAPSGAKYREKGRAVTKTGEG